jgi:hypothetical protein
MSPHSYEKALTDRRPEEHIVAVVRHHWWVLLRETIAIILLFFLPFFVVPFFMAGLASGNTSLSIPVGFEVFFSAFWALIMWHMLFMRWTDYYFDMWIITNIRIIDIDQRGFFHRDITTLLDLDHIQDINTQTVGVIGNILNFGTLMLQTAGVKIEFIMDEVAHPQKVERLIRDAQIAHAHGTPHTDSDSL